MRKKLLKLLRGIEQQHIVEDKSRKFNPGDEPSHGDFIEFLKEVDRDNLLKSEYTQYDEEYQCDYSVEEYLDFPDYRFIIKQFNNKYLVSKNGQPSPTFSSQGILAELKRMELDGLIDIGTQDGVLYAVTESRKGPDFDEGTKVARKSIILTTKGKSDLEYLRYQLKEQRFAVWALVLSFISILISLLALSFDKFLLA